LLEAGLLRRSFVPPKPIRSLRMLTRYRKAQISERQREANRLHKVMEDTGIKLDCVATDMMGRSGRAILDGHRRPLDRDRGAARTARTGSRAAVHDPRALAGARPK